MGMKEIDCAAQAISWQTIDLDTTRGKVRRYVLLRLTGCVIRGQIIEECDAHTTQNGIPYNCQIIPDQIDGITLT